MPEKRSFWQELTLQAIAPFMALLGVTVTVRPDILGQKSNIVCDQAYKTSSETRSLGGDDRLSVDEPEVAPSIDLDEITPTSGIEMPPTPYRSYEFSLPHLGILIACLILLVQIIRLYNNWKR